MDYLQYFTEGWGLGFTLGFTCLATCGMIYLPYLISTPKKLLGSFMIVLKLSLGRFIGYLIFGAAAGYFGGQIDPDLRNLITDIIYIILGVFLIISAFRRSPGDEKDCKGTKWQNFTNSAILLGLLSGVNFCPPFLLALSRAFDIGGALSGMALFTGFFFGTIIYILPLAFTGFASKIKVLRIIARIAAVLVGAWFIIYAVAGFILYSQRPKSPEPLPRYIDIVSFYDYERIYLISHPSPVSDTLLETLTEYTDGIIVTITPENTNLVLEKSGAIIIPNAKFRESFIERVKKKCLKKKCLTIFLPEFTTEVTDSVGRINIKKESKKVAEFLKTYYFKVSKNEGYYWEYREEEEESSDQ